MQNPTNRRWYHFDGKDTDTAVSTRVRLARNILGFPFPQRMTLTQKDELAKKVSEALKVKEQTFDKPFLQVNMDEISDTQALAMVERHLISPDFAKNRQGKWLMLTEDESISIMVNEEDHLRIQVMKSGMAVEECLEQAQKLDRILNETLSYAFDEKLGFLTSCPTNLGTGMRASVMLHLPALDAQNSVSAIANSVSKIGLTLRGAFGEGSRAESSLYQLSNQLSLGISEESAAQNLVSIALQVIKKERDTRSSFERIELEDKAFRAKAVLQSARILSSAELGSLVGILRIGIGCGIIDTVSNEKLTELIFDTKPANIALINTAATPRERDILRAKLVSERI